MSSITSLSPTSAAFPPVNTHARGHKHGSQMESADAPTGAARPMLNFQSGYVQRAIHEFPKSGSQGPWRVRMNYPRDLLTLRYGRINDGALRFTRRRRSATAATETAQTASASQTPAAS